MAQGTGGELVAHFRAGWDALVRFPLLVAPPLAVGVLGFVLVLLIGGGAAMMGALMGGLMGGGEGMAAGGLAGLVLGVALFGVVMGFLWLLSSALVVVMAHDALGGREPALGTAFNAVVARLGAIVGATVLVTAIVGLGFLLLFLPGVVAAVLLMFTMPAVLLDGRGVLQAMRRSVDTVREHPGPVLGLVIGAILVLVAVGIASWIVGLVPVLGHLASFVLQSAALSYLTVVAVGLYRALRPA
jgi:hypothetical protein